MIASRTFRVEVTQEDIDRGIQGKCEHCPIALAVKRAIPGGKPFVGAAVIVVELPDGTPLESETPVIASQFMLQYDSKERSPLGPFFVRPFSFDLNMKKCT